MVDNVRCEWPPDTEGDVVMMLTIDAILAMHGVGGSIGNAAVGDVLTDKTFSNVGGFHTGTMPNHTTSHTEANSYVYSGGNLLYAPPSGYYDGSTGYLLYYPEPNLLPQNILKGVSIFNVAGSVGRSASGTVSLSGSSTWAIPWYGNNGSTDTSNTTQIFGVFTATISGLSFTPSVVVANNGGPDYFVINTRNPFIDSSQTHWVGFIGGTWEQTYGKAALVQPTISSGSFEIMLQSGGTANWIAFE